MSAVSRGELRGALRRSGLSPDQVSSAAHAVAEIVERAQDDVLRELSAFLAIRQCPATAPGSPQCQKDEGHPGSHACIGLDWDPHTFEEFVQKRYEAALRRSGTGRGHSDVTGELTWPQRAAEDHRERRQAEQEALSLLASVSGRTYGSHDLGNGRARFGFETGEIEVGPGQKIVRYEDGTVLVRDA